MSSLKLTRRDHLKSLGAFAMAMGAGQIANAQAFPSRPVRWVVPFPAGGGTDIAARLIGKYWEPTFGGQFVVDNKPGAQTLIGAQSLVTAPADGYSIMSINETFAILPLMYKKLPFDTERDFTYLSTIVKVPFVLLVQKDSPIKNGKDAIAAIKAKGGNVNYGSYGVGGAPHLAMESLCDQVGGTATHVPYQGAAPNMTALLGGQIEMSFIDTATSTPYLQDGRVRAVAVSTKERVESLPAVPTLHEQGVDGFDFYSFQGIAMRKSVPAAALAKLNESLKPVLLNDALKRDFAARGYTVWPGNPEQLQREMSNTLKMVRELAVKRKINLQLDS
jgi:tripartite-type tricarboxylate transporter receptor subunit TctC